jgi:hypothetical protein
VESVVETPTEALKDVYLVWVHLQVLHWLGVGTISRVFSSPEVPAVVPSISLIAVRYPDRPREVEPWEETVKDLFRHTPAQRYSAEEVINIIISIAGQSETPDEHYVFKKWRGIVNGTNTAAKPDIHCEVALASLAKYSHFLPMEQLGHNLHLMELLHVTFSLCDQCAH